MQVQPRIALSRVDSAIQASQKHLLSIQDPAGYWWAELESNVTMTAEVVLLHKIWGTDHARPLDKARVFLLGEQRSHGGWELFFGDGGDLSTSIEAYLALRLLGVSADHRVMVQAAAFIRERGGITGSRIFTKLHLALVGCYDWRGLPSLPSWVMLLPPGAPVTIYEMSSWARGSTVPLLIVLDRKPVFITQPAVRLDELYTEGRDQARFELPKSDTDWLANLFVSLDGSFKWAESLGLTPLRDEGLKAAERWVIERQEASGDWGGIIPAMLNSLLALRTLGYDQHDPVIVRGMAAVDRFAIETEKTYRVQPCVSPVWDTALVVRALVESGLAPEHPALARAGEWLLSKQILDYGDWSTKNPQGEPGGWAFEFENRFYPDVDDTAVVVMALDALRLPDEAARRAILRAERWVVSMQCRAGGWAAFDIDNDQDWLNRIPYADLKAMIDPNTADVTARVLEMYGRTGLTLDAGRRERALEYLRRTQEPEGCWFGRWGVNYVYGTSGVLAALSVLNPGADRSPVRRACEWLLSVQNSDGGWGETCRSYSDRTLMGKGNSTASQTAWALIGLDSVAEGSLPEMTDALERGIKYLLDSQRADGTWDESEFTGTGFPGHFYLKYHLYQQHFPLTALGRCRRNLT